jgi:hypothetical protein
MSSPIHQDQDLTRPTQFRLDSFESIHLKSFGLILVRHTANHEIYVLSIFMNLQLVKNMRELFKTCTGTWLVALCRELYTNETISNLKTSLWCRNIFLVREYNKLVKLHIRVI